MTERVKYPPMDLYIGGAGGKRARVDRREIAGVPAALDGLTVLYASDFHLRGGMDPAHYVELLNAQQADLMLLGGDYSDERIQTLRLFEAFRGLRAPMGVYGCIGNNDREAFESNGELRAAMDAFGGRLLLGETVRFTNGLAVAGVDEMKYGHPSYGGLFRQDDAYRILLSHFPCLTKLPDGERPELILSGHTHGGQFNLFGLTPYSIGFEYGYAKASLPHIVVSGLFERDGSKLLVSKGLGASRLPLRIGVRPEIHVLTLRAGA